jgi:hypothetical protein
MCTLSAFSLCLLAVGVAQAAEVQLAVAANFAGPAARIAEAFSAATGHTLKISSGATGQKPSPTEVLFLTKFQGPSPSHLAPPPDST